MTIAHQHQKRVKSTRLKVWRGTNEDNGRYEEFDVAFEDGDSVLDGLVRIRQQFEPDLAIRFSCFNANVCKECTIKIDGAVAYACTTRLVADRVMTLAPLSGKVQLRDLVSETRPPSERL